MDNPLPRSFILLKHTASINLLWNTQYMWKSDKVNDFIWAVVWCPHSFLLLQQHVQPWFGSDVLFPGFYERKCIARILPEKCLAIVNDLKLDSYYLLTLYKPGVALATSVNAGWNVAFLPCLQEWAQYLRWWWHVTVACASLASPSSPTKWCLTTTVRSAPTMRRFLRPHACVLKIFSAWSAISWKRFKVMLPGAQATQAN